MNTATFIAKRYLLSKKSIQAINIISGISTAGVLVASGALILILSVFNGLENLILDMYSSFTAELRIEPASGKVFEENTTLFSQIKQHPSVANYSDILQEKVLLRHGDYQYIATLKGVDSTYRPSAVMDSLLWDGTFMLKAKGVDYAVLGAAAFTNLGISLEDANPTIEVFSPKKGVKNALNPADEFNDRNITLTGVFRAQQELDNLVVVPIDFARDVLGEYSGVSALEVNLKPKANVDKIHKAFEKLLGKSYQVKNRAQQNPALYKLLNSEKWMVFFILAFVLVIAAFNIVGSLTMLVIDKQKDVAVLSSLGASNRLIKQIFFLEGMFIAMAGCIIGLVIGALLCIAQQAFGLVRMGAENMVTDVYPVAMRPTDFILVFLTVLLVSGIASAVSAQLSVRNMTQLRAAE
ncbi:FtsX-like permease family protein [Olivibacter ginsenosidimutans]|uniref:FtsX-like permease family protein n=1 Tax=Olivibacter ginsenosidimutans TaxID=1176537 RepID=A0ABP9AJW3_9SPHI